MMVPNVAKRGRDDDQPHERQWHNEIASESPQGHTFTAGCRECVNRHCIGDLGQNRSVCTRPHDSGRLPPRLALSVGFGPVSSPQKLLALNNYRPPHATSRSGHPGKANPARRNGSNPKFCPPASRATAASSSYCNRNPVFAAASAREYRCGARKRCPRGKPGLSGAIAHLAAWATELAEEVRSNASGTSVPAMGRSPESNRMPELLPRYKEVLLQALRPNSAERPW
jgi:hypothetical protein